MPVRDAGRRSGCVCETAPGASADVRRRKPSGVAVANPPQTGCSRPLSTSTEGKASRRPGELRSDLLGEKSGLGWMGYWMAEAHGQTRGRQEAPPASVTEGDPPPGYPVAQIPLIFRARSQTGHPPTFLSGHRWAMPTL